MGFPVSLALQRVLSEQKNIYINLTMNAVGEIFFSIFFVDFLSRERIMTHGIKGVQK